MMIRGGECGEKREMMDDMGWRAAVAAKNA